MNVRANSGLYEAVIKVDRKDTPGQRAQDIAEGISYACALLQDEYGWTAEKISRVLEEAIDAVEDSEASR